MRMLAHHFRRCRHGASPPLVRPRGRGAAGMHVEGLELRPMPQGVCNMRTIMPPFAIS
jgi:hypothetical protein